MSGVLKCAVVTNQWLYYLKFYLTFINFFIILIYIPINEFYRILHIHTTRIYTNFTFVYNKNFRSGICVNLF